MCTGLLLRLVGENATPRLMPVLEQPFETVADLGDAHIQEIVVAASR